MDERSFFLASTAVGLMQTVESGLLLSRQGRVSSMMCLSSAVEAGWFGTTLLALWDGWVEGSRMIWPVAFVVYFVVAAVLSRRVVAPGLESLEKPVALDDIQIHPAVVVGCLCFSVTYGIGSFLTWRTL